MSNIWVLLLVQASSMDEALKVAKEKVNPDVWQPYSRPFLQANGVYAIDVMVQTLAKVTDWANCFKEDSKPALLAHFRLTPA